MIPLLAAVSAVETIDHVASGAMAAWKLMSSARTADDATSTNAASTGHTSTGFATWLSPHAGHATAAAGSAPAVSPSPASTDRLVDRLA